MGAVGGLHPAPLGVPPVRRQVPVGAGGGRHVEGAEVLEGDHDRGGGRGGGCEAVAEGS